MKKAIATGLVGLIALGGAGFAAPNAFAHDAETDDATRTERSEARAERRAARQALLSETLGLSVEDLRAAREAGQSVADIAAEQGVPVQSLIDTLVTNAQARIDAKIAEGDIDADRAAEKLDSLEERITARVNGEGGEGRRGHHGMRGEGPQA